MVILSVVALSICSGGIAASAQPLHTADTTVAPDPATSPGAPAGVALPTVAGANDWNCKLSAAHPRPVVLVHGTGIDMTAWTVLAPQLTALGYCVYALNYGAIRQLFHPEIVNWGVGDIDTSSKELKTFVDTVLQRTGATDVDMVGHSQGGVVARQYLKFDGGSDPSDPARNKVHSLVTLGATNHGTSFGGLQQLGTLLVELGLPGYLLTPYLWGPAGAQQLIGSPVLASLNAGGDVEPGVSYTVIGTRDDEVSTPPAGTFLRPDADASVKNQWVQDTCPSATTTHVGLLTDPAPLYLVKVALDPAYAATNPAPC